MGQSTFTANGTAPFVFDYRWNNFGNLRPESRRLSETNNPVRKEDGGTLFVNARRFHSWEPPRELLESMPMKRRSLFRHAYGAAANTGLETRNLVARAVG